MTTARVVLWGRVIGAVTFGGEPYSSFEYTDEFVESQIEVSPVTMPLRKGPFNFPNLSQETFHGLPGLLADSLPDRFGNSVINAWLQSQGREEGSMNPVEKLLYLGERGAGALCYVPALSPGEESFPVEVSQLAAIVQEIHEKKQKFELKEAGTETKKGLAALVSMSSSAGGARAKAILAWNRDTDMFRSGQTYAGEGYSYWILKFDGASESGSIKGPPGYGKIEYAYYKMARDAGIQMSESRLYADAHFMTKRFDRSDGGEKLHMLSLGALGHYDYNRPTEHTYEQAFGILKKLGGGNDEREQLFRRMAFNIIARNQDDHVKNISFLMDKSGKWSLSPAYDMTYAWKAIGWTAKHQMSMNGKRDGFTKNDFVEFGKTVGLKQGASARLLGEVKIAVNKWEQYAEDSGVEKIVQQQIKEKHRMNL